MKLPQPASDERRTVLLKTASYVAKNVASILDPNQLLQRTVDIICEAFDFYYAGVFLIDHSGQWAVLRAGYGSAGAAMIAEGHKLKVGGTSMIGSAVAQYKAQIALDVGEEAAHFQNPHLPQTRSEMALPLLAGDEAIGALSVQSEEEGAFTQEDIATLQSMADQLAVAIKNSRLHRQNQELLRQAERRGRLLEAAHEVGHKVTSILDMDELLPKTVDIICQAYGFYYAGIFLVDASGEWAALRAGYGEAGAAMLAEGHKLKVGGYSMIGASIYFREARIALDVGDEAVHFKNPHLPNTRSEMALPLVVGDKVLGAVTVQSIEESAFNSDDITTLQTMAEQLAIAINNAQLLKDLKRAHADLLRTKTYEALATATTEAVHWIGNKALPITTTIARIREDLASGEIDIQSLSEDLGLIAESAAQIVEIKENLLGAARERRPRPVMVMDIWQAAAQERGIPTEKLTIEAAPNLPLALGDSTQLVRAFGNLLQNAHEAQAEHISVEIQSAEEEGYIMIRLSDDGHGMPEDIQEKVWAAFFTTKDISHHGLGLAACLHVITQMDGSIHMESIPGDGTRFTILLPASLHKPTPTDFKGTAHTIFLIDDDDDWARFVFQTLLSAGKSITRQNTLSGAKSADLILVDQALTAEPVIGVLQQIQEMGLAPKTILVSAALKVEGVTEYMKTGVKDVALKPYTAEELARLLS